LDGLDHGDRDRPLINREVPRPTSVVPLVVAWKHEVAGEPAPQRVEIARPGAIGEIRGTSAVAHERHATSSTFSVLTARRCGALHASSRWQHEACGRSEGNLRYRKPPGLHSSESSQSKRDYSSSAAFTAAAEVRSLSLTAGVYRVSADRL